MSTPRHNFATTQWTLVWQAASDDSNHSRPALEHFIQRYWQPLYYYARQNGLSQSDAEDATQEFLSEILDGKLLSQANPVKGRFRTYLLTAWKRFLVDEYRRAGRKRPAAICADGRSIPQPPKPDGNYPPDEPMNPTAPLRWPGQTLFWSRFRSSLPKIILNEADRCCFSFCGR